MASPKTGTSVRPCTCEHKTQDSLYGRGMRLHNNCGKKEKQDARCSVCGRAKQ